MKKIFLLLFCICLILTLGACGKKSSAEYRLGMGIIANTDGEEGAAILNGTVAAVVMDAEGKIVECRLDAIDNEVDIDNGTLDRDDIDEEFETKQEQGTDYGMKEASSIDREWYEQADHFANYVEGLTSDQVSAIGTSDETKTDQIILSGCTIDISDFIKAIVLACEDEYARPFKSSDFNLGLGVYSKVSADESEDAKGGDGKIKMQITVSTAAVNKEGEALAVLVDTMEPELKFNTSGAVTNASERVKTKKELGDSYGMKEASKIGREWYEHAKAFEDYTVGLDGTGVNSIMITDDKKPEDNILRAGCTIAVNDFMHAVYKAINYAR